MKKQITRWAVAVCAVAAMSGCSGGAADERSPLEAAEDHYFYYYDGSRPRNPNCGEARHLESMTPEERERYENDVQKYKTANRDQILAIDGEYKGFEVIDEKVSFDGMRVDMNLKFMFEKRNHTKEYTAYKCSDGSWNIVSN